MSRLTIFALGITELRDMFRAIPELADRLRAIAADQFPAPSASHRRGSLLGRIGPVMKRPIDPHQAPARPTPGDVEALLAGRAIEPERLTHAWQILLAWLDATSWDRLDFDLAPQQMSDLEFDLARAGLPSQFALENLMLGNPQLPLQPLPGQRFGYSKHAHAEATRHALSMVMGDLGETALAVAGPLLEFLNQYPHWAEKAAEAGRPAPDLVVVWMPPA
jgi:hypothetical protein